MRNVLAIGALFFGACSTAEEPEANHPPFIVTSTPAEGSIVTLGPGTSREIAATIADENISDDLFMRFLLDYPGNSETGQVVRSVQFPPNGTTVRSPMSIQTDCRSLAVGPGLHRLMLSVSDRPFLDVNAGEDVDPEAPLDSVRAGANRVRVVWVLNCP